MYQAYTLDTVHPIIVIAAECFRKQKKSRISRKRLQRKQCRAGIFLQKIIEQMQLLTIAAAECFRKQQYEIESVAESAAENVCRFCR